MPKVGDLTVEVRAVTSQFERGTQRVNERLTSMERRTQLLDRAQRRADASFRRIATDVQQASVAFRAGTLSAEGYATAMSVARREATALAATGVAPAGRELTAFNTIMTQTAPKAAQARQGLGTVRSTVASLGARMAGVNGTVGSLIGGIGQFALGNLAAIGVIGGIAALVAGFRKLGESARESSERADEAAASLKELRIARAGIGDLQELGAGQRALQDERDRLFALTQKVNPRTGTRVSVSAATTDRIAELDGLLQQGRNEIARVERELAQEREKVIRDSSRRNIAALRKLFDMLDQIALRLARPFQLERGLAPSSRVTSGDRARASLESAGAGPNGGLRTIAPRDNPTLRLQFRESLSRGTAAIEMWQQIGATAGRTVSAGVVQAFLTNRAKFSEVLGTIFAAAVSRAIGSLVVLAVTNFVSNLAGTLAGSAATGGTGGVGGLTDAVPVSTTGVSTDSTTILIPPPANPLAQARDREWLNFLGESNLNLKVLGA